MISMTNTFMLQVSEPYLFLKDKFAIASPFHCLSIIAHISANLFKIVGEVNLQIFLNKIIVWFDAVTLKKL